MVGAVRHKESEAASSCKVFQPGGEVGGKIVAPPDFENMKPFLQNDP